MRKTLSKATGILILAWLNIEVMFRRISNIKIAKAGMPNKTVTAILIAIDRIISTG